jgi:hypothetical protein
MVIGCGIGRGGGGCDPWGSVCLVPTSLLTLLSHVPVSLGYHGELYNGRENGFLFKTDDSEGGLKGKEFYRSEDKG